MQRRRTPRVLAGLLAATVLVACTLSYTVEYQVSVAEDVDLSGEPTLVLAMLDEDESGSQAERSDTERLTDAYSIDTLASSADVRDYVRRTEALGSASTEFFLYAFLDLDGDGAWQPGEPWGVDPNNPVTIVEDGYESAITIENDAEANP
ncbi:hypothetical protein [Plesiocystis pacifica]|uniref:hypothetical protein n=1 Tax=Plesiocystis pacifica TaxID=191768 RepID=UPI0012FA89A6|nr:hypothetical protein [Plesiocystis pacifica]